MWPLTFGANQWLTLTCGQQAEEVPSSSQADLKYENKKSVYKFPINVFGFDVIWQTVTFTCAAIWHKWTVNTELRSQ